MKHCLSIAGLAFFTVVAFADTPPQRTRDISASPAWKVDDQERAARRADRAASAARRRVAIAEGDARSDFEGNVVLGRHNPELLMPWELMEGLPQAFSNDVATRSKYRAKWARGSRYLGEDMWTRLHAIAGPFIDADLENARLQRQLKTATGAEREKLEASRQLVNGSLCRLRADAIAAARTTFGKELFDAFLYEVLAADAVILTSTSGSPESLAGTWLWVEGGCR